MVFRPHPQVIQRFFNINWFGPPPRVTGDSACSWIDHQASGLPRPTRRALRTRFRFGSAIRLNLAGTRKLAGSLCKRHAVTLAGSHSLGAHDFRVFSLPSEGFFSPFPHGTCALSVGGWYLALWNGLHGFRRGFTCPALLGDSLWTRNGFADGAFTLCGAAFQPLPLADPSPMPGPRNPAR